MDIYNHPSYKYAFDVVSDNIKLDNTPIKQGKYIIKQCKKFLNDLENSDCEYFIDESELEKITNLTKLINMGDGLKVGESAYEALVGFQWFFIVNIFCWKHKDNIQKRRYETLTLLIARKAGKTFLVGLIFILLMLIEPRFSEFYSVAPDKELSSKIKEEMGKILDSSPHLKKRFKEINSETKCLINESKFKALAYSENRMDARKANVFVCDEVGGLRKRYPIDAMRSSQINMINRTGILISTAYESQVNPMVEEVEYAEKVLDGVIEDDTLFALLYKPDDEENWTNDLALYQANPLCFELKDNLDYLLKQREKAINLPTTTSNFKTKHLNIFINGSKEEVFMDVKDLKICEINSYDWKNKDVILSFDLSMSFDNTAVSILTYDKNLNKYVAQSWGFIPKSKLETKSQEEKVPYNEYISRGWCFACGDRKISYSFIEEFIMTIENKLGCKVKMIGYDKYEALSTVSKLEDNDFTCVEVGQGYWLHSSIKKMKEVVIDKEFAYVKNDLFVLNVANAREESNPQAKLKVSKKKSKGKIDLLASLLNSFELIEQIEETSVYEDGGIFII
ncbi:terminase large subunit [Romboutsia sedimentorum]|uniref:terminase TerL endonuclease subunit n=1 Tax=Romboutsia sedimentorum TaxID=1368474 RepID=UPI0024DE5CF0|nr:terminase TerL endonuclease subunit [Romboutsia sedimentorum]MDK2587483.1 terminase large subunit [Romboutsia sedimentorum]